MVLEGFGRERLPKLLAELERRRMVRGYPTLVEASGAPVAQFEHTMKLEGNSLGYPYLDLDRGLGVDQRYLRGVAAL